MKRRDEQGAYAVIFGILVLFLASLAALAIDLGNAMARKSDVRGQADFAALGAGALLEDNLLPPAAVPTAVLDEARELLNENRARNWGSDCSTGPMCITSNEQLINGELLDGEVRFANGGLQVLTPVEQVDFELAQIMLDDPGKEHGMTVQGDATVRIGSYGFLSLPAYAVDPCDYGRQVLTDPTSGHATPINVPPLTFDSQANSTQLVSISPDSVAFDNDLAVAQPTISVTAKKYTRTTHVGFFSAGGAVHEVAIPVPPSPVSNPATTTVSGIEVPQEVTSVEEVWYVRVRNDEANTPADPTDDRWSARSEARPLRIGNAVLECDSDIFGGNFGTIRMDRTDEEGEELARNFSEGFQDPINVIPHQPTPIPGGECSHGDGYGSVESSESHGIGFNSDTDCLLTDPGLPANAVMDGLVKGGSGFKGRLADEPTRSGCDPSGGSSSATVAGVSINNDVLSCFLTDPTMPLSTIATAGYSGGPALHSDIWDSPRFTLVPVLSVQPSNGLKRYSVIEMRPAFITDESLSATSGNSTANPSENGLRLHGNDIEQLTVVFFNIDALPPNPGGDIIEYLGDGPKAVQLID